MQAHEKVREAQQAQRALDLRGADPVTGTDGLAALGGPVGAFPEGLIVVQDDADTDGEAASTVRTRQNFKLVDWRAVKSALAIN